MSVVPGLVFDCADLDRDIGCAVGFPGLTPPMGLCNLDKFSLDEDLFVFSFLNKPIAFLSRSEKQFLSATTSLGLNHSARKGIMTSSAYCIAMMPCTCMVKRKKVE